MIQSTQNLVNSQPFSISSITLRIFYYVYQYTNISNFCCSATSINAWVGFISTKTSWYDTTVHLNINLGSLLLTPQSSSILIKSILINDLGIKSIRAQKLRHAQAVKLLQGICTELRNIKPDRVLGYRVHQAVIQAIKQGNVEFVTGMIKSIPELVWNGDINDRNIFSIAILNCQEKIFNLLHGLTNVNKMKVTSDDDRFGNNMLHLAAMLAPSDQLDGISGAALQMQRELQWFKVNIFSPYASHKIIFSLCLYMYFIYLNILF